MIRITYRPLIRFLDQPGEDIEIESERDWDLAYVHRLVDRINTLIESQTRKDAGDHEQAPPN